MLTEMPCKNRSTRLLSAPLGVGRCSGKAPSIRDTVTVAIISDNDRQIVVTDVYVIGTSAV
jgi:hypothetical protein